MMSLHFFYKNQNKYTEYKNCKYVLLKQWQYTYYVDIQWTIVKDNLQCVDGSMFRHYDTVSFPKYVKCLNCNYCFDCLDCFDYCCKTWCLVLVWRPVLHHYFSGPQESWIVFCLHLEKKSAHALGASVVWHPSLPLMNSFKKPMLLFPVQAMLPEGVPFHQLHFTTL